MVSIEHCIGCSPQLTKARKGNKRYKVLEWQKEKVTGHRLYNCLIKTETTHELSDMVREFIGCMGIFRITNK